MGGSLNISVDMIMDTLVEEINYYLDKYDIIYPIVAYFVTFMAFYYLFRGIYAYKKRSVHSEFFIVFCISAILVSFGAGLTATFGEEISALVPLLATSVYICVPAIICLHTWSQVDYKPIKVKTYILYFFIPIVVTIINFIDLLNNHYYGNVWNFFMMPRFSLQSILFSIYWIAMVVKCLSLCFNVFYQMPKHMRGSTTMIITARIVTAFITLFAFLIATEEVFLLVLLAFLLAMNRFLRGFFRANASNVIATSRQFVFSNLSTMIMVLSLKGRILEWNKPDGKNVFTILKPRYLQDFIDYKNALLVKGKGIVSPHDENIITITDGAGELNLMITSKPIDEGNRQFGTLVEISEITSIYSILRVMESIAELDHMTGLFNRNSYMTMAEKMMKEEYMPLLIIVGDVNNLKFVNDTFSHLSGDRLLCVVSEIIKAEAPKDSFVARIGGDEIVILVPGGTEQQAVAFSNKVFAETQKVYDSEFGQPSISLGWSIIKSSDEQYNEAFARADEMMYEHKRAYKEGKPLVLSGTLQTKN